MLSGSLTCGSEDPVQDGLETLATLLQRVEIAGLAVRRPLHCIERETLQADVAF